MFVLRPILSIFGIIKGNGWGSQTSRINHGQLGVTVHLQNKNKSLLHTKSLNNYFYWRLIFIKVCFNNIRIWTRLKRSKVEKYSYVHPTSNFHYGQSPLIDYHLVNHFIYILWSNSAMHVLRSVGHVRKCTGPFYTRKTSYWGHIHLSLCL